MLASTSAFLLPSMSLRRRRTTRRRPRRSCISRHRCTQVPPSSSAGTVTAIGTAAVTGAATTGIAIMAVAVTVTAAMATITATVAGTKWLTPGGHVRRHATLEDDEKTAVDRR